MAAPIAIDQRFADQCSPVISSNYDTCGTVTRSTIEHLSVDQLADLFTPGGLFADMEAWFFHSIEMAACGTQRYGLYDWIMANAEREVYRGAVSGQKVVGSTSLMFPFIMAMTESVINSDHFKISQGQRNDAYNPTVTGPLTALQLGLGLAADRVIRVITRYSVPMDANWFRERDSIHIFGQGAGGVTEHGQWKVLAAANNTGMTYVDILVTSLNAASDEPFDDAPADGVVTVGINNVNDYEQWCANLANMDPRKEVPFWIQTFRNSRCVSSTYKEVYAKLNSTNPAWRAFGDLPLAKRNAQDEHEYQKRFVNDFFWNKPLENQTLELWKNLETIETVTNATFNPDLGGLPMARRANFIGVVEQLRLCNRVKDILNNPLNFYEFLNLNYDIKRARQKMNGGGRKVTDIDWWTDSVFAANFMTGAIAYYTAEFGTSFHLNWDITTGSNEKLGARWTSYFFKHPANVRINILTHDYFDDRLDQFVNAGYGSAGRVLWCLDLGKKGAGSIYYAQIATNRRTTTTADINELARLDSSYRCVMETVSLDQTLNSETGTVIVECPLNSFMIQGIADEVPITTGVSGDTEDDQTNLY